MKKIIIITAALLAASAAQAFDYDKFCTAHGEMAEVIMKNRQAGTALSEMLTVAKDDDLIRSVVMMAYKQPRMRMPENQTEMVVNFRSERELACFKTAEKHKLKKQKAQKTAALQ